MAATGTARPSDPFVDRRPSSVVCRWMSPPTKETRVVRLLVDDDGWKRHWPNVFRLGKTLARVRATVRREAPTAKLIVTPAGMLTVPLATGPLPTASWSSDCWASIRPIASQLHLGDGAALLLGVDGALPGLSTPVQASILIRGCSLSREPSLTALKLYPSGAEERRSLLGWQLFGEDRLPPARRGERLHSIGNLSVASLICHEAVAFSGRSESRRGPLLRRLARQLATLIGVPRYLHLAVHRNAGTSGGVFLDATRRLASRFGSTVVPSMFAPKAQLAEVAERFKVVAARGLDRSVATLLVES